MKPAVYTRQNAGAVVQETSPGGWRLEIPAGPSGVYRWAQLDDHLQQARSTFPWRAPLRMELRARVSAPDLPGTWGFGFWNDPFSASLGVSGTARRLPALPNAAWFFFAGRPNYLALRDDHPAQGFLAATFSAVRVPSLLFAPGVVMLPFLALPLTARLLRRAARLLLREDAALVSADPTYWCDYRIDWHPDQVQFFVNGSEIFATRVSPHGPLGLVIWIDNQYAAFPPSGKLRTGTSPNPEPAWLELEGLELTTGL
jgi:hypothetical protein